MKKERYGAIVLAAGQGKRMQSNVQKQYMLLEGHPVLYYALRAFEESPVDEVVLVVAQGEVSYCIEEIVEKYHFTKVRHVIEGGKERYDSVYAGLCALQNADYVLIHDGARPFVTSAIIRDAMDGAKNTGACVVGMPVKDTIKVIDANRTVVDTPKRDALWQVQTPQAFSYPLVREAYDLLQQADTTGLSVTDDAMVVETFTSHTIQLIPGSYTNMKITTPEDMAVGAAILRFLKA